MTTSDECRYRFGENFSTGLIFQPLKVRILSTHELMLTVIVPDHPLYWGYQSTMHVQIRVMSFTVQKQHQIRTVQTQKTMSTQVDDLGCFTPPFLAYKSGVLE